MSLLTPTEAVTFQMFLSSVDYTESYNGPTPAEWMLLHHGVRHPDDAKQTYPEAPKLKKATLDLMSLDASDANAPSPEPRHKPSAHLKQPYPYLEDADRGVPSDRPGLLIENVRQTYPPHSSSSSPPSEGAALPVSPAPYSSPSSSSGVLRPSSSRLSTRSSSKRTFDTVSTSTQPSASTSYLPTTQRAKRSRQSPPPLQHTSDASQSPTLSSRQSAQTQDSASSSSRSQLLSASQKRANHIQSEQKRRANIRRGYEALCETVPALKEAIRKEEEEAATMFGSTGSSSSRNSARKKKSKNDTDDGEKIDGRAGPRSENIVLQKTIDYIQELNATKEDLLRRLAQARGALPPDHPLLCPRGIPNLATGQNVPLWEREWNYSPDADDEGSEDETN